MNAMEPLRVLHVVGGMNRGGIETWLMHVLRTADRDRLRMDFLAHTSEPCPYDAELLALGSRLFQCPNPNRLWRYGGTIRRVMAVNGPYDVVHSHIHLANGRVLRLARQAGVPVRLAHSHNDTSVEESRAGLLRHAYAGLMRRWIARHATAGLACSAVAAADLFGPSWKADDRWRVLPYGIDLTPFRGSVDAAEVRAELKLPSGAFVVGHVGRFVTQKNHAFLLDVAAILARRSPDFHLLLIGEGELHGAVAARVAKLGLSGRVTFTGGRPDVPRLMRGGMDAFLFPSLYEGLGLVLVEAQAAGLPSILADVVPEEADIVPELMQRLSLAQPASAWADAVLAARNGNRRQPEALAAVEQSAFNIQTSARALEGVYRDCVVRSRAARRLAHV